MAEDNDSHHFWDRLSVKVSHCLLKEAIVLAVHNELILWQHLTRSSELLLSVEFMKPYLVVQTVAGSSQTALSLQYYIQNSLTEILFSW